MVKERPVGTFCSREARAQLIQKWDQLLGRWKQRREARMETCSTLIKTAASGKHFAL